MTQRVWLYMADSIEFLKTTPDCWVDAVVCDPPYGLEFMGKDWDRLGDKSHRHAAVSRSGAGLPRFGSWAPYASATAIAKLAEHRNAMQEWHRAWAVEALRVLKPGGHIVAFGGSRTYHRLACALEDAGFEIRDSLMWIYLNGFPKSLNIGDGRGTALKPAHEPCVLARKPLDGTVAANVAKWGTGALNIDASKNNERWPANVIVDEDAAPEFTKYFYCPKVSRAERDTGCESLPERTAHETVERDPESAGAKNPRAGAGRGAGAATQECVKCGKNVDGGRAVQPCSAGGEHEIVAGEARPAVKNHHPCLKPVALMRWLIRLVTPPGGIVLDPFMGSGSTGVAAMLEGMRFVGIDREAEYAEIAHARISAWERFK